MNEPGLYGPGGGRVGAVLLSPFVKPGTVSKRDYNHFSLLGSIEDLFGLAHLGDAKLPQAHPFGTDVYTGSLSSLLVPGWPQSPVRHRAGDCGPRDGNVTQYRSVSDCWAARV